MTDKKHDLIDQKLQELNNDGVDRRGFLKCMAWADTGLIWTMSGGIPVSRAFAKTDFGATFRRAINITNRNAIHITEADFNNPNHIQMIANTAAFHFGYIEQGGASLYQALSQKAIRTAFAIAVGFASLMAVFPRARAQMIVPVDRTLHPPDGFDFSGQWNCGDGVSIAHVDVENRNRSSRGAAFRPEGGAWTEIRESQDGFNGDYYVGYDRDKSQFLMIDADEAASVAYSTEGWNGNKLLLTSTNDKGQLGLPHRIQYDVDDSRQFTVIWEILEGAAWKADPGFKCTKVDRRGSIPPKK
jgi:hypothetical protein